MTVFPNFALPTESDARRAPCERPPVRLSRGLSLRAAFLTCTIAVLAAFAAPFSAAQPPAQPAETESPVPARISTPELEDRVRYYFAVNNTDGIEQALAELGSRDPENHVFVLYGKMLQFAKTGPDEKRRALSVRGDILTSSVTLPSAPEPPAFKSPAPEPSEPVAVKSPAPEPPAPSAAFPSSAEPTTPSLAAATPGPETPPAPAATPLPARPAFSPATPSAGQDAMGKLNALVKEVPGGWIMIGTLGGLLFLLILIGILKPRRIPVLEEPSQARPPDKTDEEAPPEPATRSLRDITLQMQDTFQAESLQPAASEGDIFETAEAGEAAADSGAASRGDEDSLELTPPGNEFADAGETPRDLTDYSLFSAPPVSPKKEGFSREKTGEREGPETISIFDKEGKRLGQDTGPVSFGAPGGAEQEEADWRVPFASPTPEQQSHQLSEFDNPLDLGAESLSPESLLDLPDALPEEKEGEEDTFFRSNEKTRTHLDSSANSTDTFFHSDDRTKTHAEPPASPPGKTGGPETSSTDDDTFFGSQDETIGPGTPRKD